jgi:hypothetical protein
MYATQIGKGIAQADFDYALYRQDMCPPLTTPLP